MVLIRAACVKLCVLNLLVLQSLSNVLTHTAELVISWQDKNDAV